MSFDMHATTNNDAFLLAIADATFVLPQPAVAAAASAAVIAVVDCDNFVSILTPSISKPMQVLTVRPEQPTPFLAPGLDNWEHMAALAGNAVVPHVAPWPLSQAVLTLTCLMLHCEEELGWSILGAP